MEITEASIYDMAPFARTLGIRFPELTPERVRAELTVIPELSTLGGGLHGGAIMSLCDVAAAVCVGLHAPEGSGWTTVESTTAFLKPVRGPLAVAIAEPVKVGRTLVHMTVDVHSGDEHAARTSQVLLIR